ncbi:MAG TPA: hypothetical protein VIJ22_16880 [Polyangiaceae bacterium]
MFSIFTWGSGGGGAEAVGAGSTAEADGVGVAVAEGSDAALVNDGGALAGSGCCIGVDGARSQATPA